MFFVTIAYSVIVMYEYNRTGVHQPPTPEPVPIIMDGSVGVTRRLGLFELCSVDLADWGGFSQILVNFTAVCAWVLIADIVKVALQTLYRTGNLCYFWALPDNMYNLATAIVQQHSSLNIVVPNAIGMLSRVISGTPGSFKGCACVPSDLEHVGELDHHICDFFFDEIWEVFVGFVVLAQWVQTIVMPSTDCQAGPTLGMSALAKPPVDFTDWTTAGVINTDQALVNIACILSVFFLANTIFDWCEAGCRFRDFMDKPNRVHGFIIAIQTGLLMSGLPVPTALGRLVKPLLVISGFGRKKEYEKVTAKEIKETVREIAKEEDEEGGQWNACCTRGSSGSPFKKGGMKKYQETSLNSWQC